MTASWLVSNPNVASPLRRAADHKLWDVCEVLVASQQFDRSMYDHSYALHQAATAGRVGLVQKLLDQGAWVGKLWSTEGCHQLNQLKCDKGCVDYQYWKRCSHTCGLEPFLTKRHPLSAAAAK
jgi:hypothetical protein